MIQLAVFVVGCYVSDKRTLYLYFTATLVTSARCFVVDCYVSEKRALYLYFIVTLVISAGFVLSLFVTLVISAHLFVPHCYVSDKARCVCLKCYVSEKRTLYLYYIATLVISVHSVFYLIVTLVISARYICTLLLRYVLIFDSLYGY